MALRDYREAHNLSYFTRSLMDDTEIFNNTNDIKPPLFMMEPTLAKLQDYVRILHDYYLPSIYVGAIVGNVLCLVVLLAPTLRCFSTTHYLYGILLSEILHSLALLHLWLEEIGVDTGTYQIGGWCQFATFVTSVAEFLTIWYTVALVIDRTLWICYSRNKNQTCNPLIAKVVLVGLAVIAIVVYLNISILYETIVAGPRLVCTTSQAHDRVHEHLSKGHLLFNGLLPLLSILTLLIIIHTFSWCGRIRHPDADVIQLEPITHISPGRINGVSGHRGYVTHNTDNKIMNQIGFFSFFAILFVAFNAPIYIYRLYEVIVNMTHTEQGQQASLRHFLLLQILQYIKCTKYGLNIFVFLTAYPLFRSTTNDLGHRVVLCLCKVSGNARHVNNVETAVPEDV